MVRQVSGKGSARLHPQTRRASRTLPQSHDSSDVLHPYFERPEPRADCKPNPTPNLTPTSTLRTLTLILAQTLPTHVPRRFLDAAELPEDRRPGPLVALRDGVVFAAYNTYTSVEPLRKLAGANADTGYNPRVRLGSGLSAPPYPSYSHQSYFEARESTDPTALLVTNAWSRCQG